MHGIVVIFHFQDKETGFRKIRWKQLFPPTLEFFVLHGILCHDSDDATPLTRFWLLCAYTVSSSVPRIVTSDPQPAGHQHEWTIFALPSRCILWKFPYQCMSHNFSPSGYYYLGAPHLMALFQTMPSRAIFGFVLLQAASGSIFSLHPIKDIPAIPTYRHVRMPELPPDETLALITRAAQAIKDREDGFEPAIINKGVVLSTGSPAWFMALSRLSLPPARNLSHLAFIAEEATKYVNQV